MKARLLLILLLLCTLHTASEARAQCADWEVGPLDNGAGPNGANGNIYATLGWDPDGAGPLLERLVVGGEFTSIGGVAATNIAQWAPETGQWQPFGGVIGQVNDLELFNGQIVAGCSGDNNVGTFDLTVRRWDGANWIPMSVTNTGSVTTLHVHNGALYVGGSFVTQFTSGVNPAHYVARWNPGVNAWDAMPEADFGTQTNTNVRALATYNGELYVGGWKADSGTVTGSKKYLTRGNVGSAFTPVTTDVESGSIMALNVFAGELLIGGGFGTFNGVTCNSFAAWNGSSVHGFSTGIGPFPGQGTLVTTITIHNGIMVGGEFATAGGVTVNRVAFWPPGGVGGWQALGSGTNARVWDLVSYRGSLAVGGEFTVTDRPANHLAYWDGTGWGSFGGGSGSYVLAMTPYNGRLVAGGVFHQSTAALNTAHNIAGWNGGTAQAFGTGMNGAVQALKSFKYSGVNGSHELIAGGAFTVAGGLASNFIARWNERPNVAFPPPAWAPMGAGFNSYVYAIERSNGITFAGGAFTGSGATSVPYIAQWNETTDTWGPVGFGMNGFVYALKEYNGSLYAGGNFSSAGGSATGGLARWTGSFWSTVGGGAFNGIVLSMEVHDGKLVIGGQFSQFPGNPNLIQYDGVSFSAFGNGGANNNVRSLKSYGTHLYVGGDFTTIGGLPANRIAYWDGLWHDLQFGTDSAVYALGSYQNEVHVGGAFTNVDYNGIAAPLLSPFWARYTETGAPWFVQYPFSKTAQLGDDVVFAAQVASGFTVSYQWYRNGVPLVDGPTGYGSTIGGATAATLQISDAVWSDHGTYKVVATNACGSAETFPVTLEFTGVTAAPAPGNSFTTVFEALGPNPAGSSSQLAFSLAHDAAVRVRIHDVRGRLVRAMDVGRLSPGRHMTSWDARDNQGQRVAAGAYLVRLEVDGQPIGSKRLTILH